MDNSVLSAYSLWLTPSKGAALEELQNTINDISKRYSTPAFPPHVTLIGRISGPELMMMDRTATIASRIRQLRVAFGTIDKTDEYFRSLFIRIRKTEEIDGAASVARKVFGEEHRAEYMPHMSLMYADMPVEKKESIAVEYGLQGLAERIGSVAIDRISVYRTSADVGKWKWIRDFELGGFAEGINPNYGNDSRSWYSAKTI